MKTIIEKEELRNDSLLIKLNEDTEIRIKINQFGELVVNKQYYGKDDSSLIIMPSVSNEIRIK